jgi:hypothetical protein
MVNRISACLLLGLCCIPMSATAHKPPEIPVPSAIRWRLLVGRSLIILPSSMGSSTPLRLLTASLVLSIASSSILLVLHFTVTRTSYSNSFIVARVVVAGVDGYYLFRFVSHILKDYALSMPILNGSRERAFYLPSMVTALVVTSLLGTFSLGEDFTVPWGWDPFGVAIGLVAFHFAARLAAFICAVSVCRSEDASLCAQKHDLRCQRCNFSGVEVGTRRSRLAPLCLHQTKLLVSSAIIAAAALYFSVQLTAKEDRFIVQAAIILFGATILHHGMFVALKMAPAHSSYASETPRRSVLWNQWQWTPYIYARSIALLWFAHVALLPAFIDAKFESSIIIASVFEVLSLAAAWTLANIIIEDRNRARCEEEEHQMWRCIRAFCPVYGMG